MRKSIINPGIIIIPVLLVSLVCIMSKAFGDTNQDTNSVNTNPLAELRNQHDKLALENEIAEQMLQNKLSAIQTEIEEITKKLELSSKRAALKDTERKEKEDEELADMKFTVEKIKLSNDLAEAKNAGDISRLGLKKNQYQLRMTELELQKMELDNKLVLLNSELDAPG